MIWANAPLQGDTGGRTGTAPTKHHHIFPRNPIQTKFRPCAIRPYPSPPNRTVRHYPIRVILSIAQGWQVQRSLPWVTMQVRRLPPWGLYFFHHIAFLCPPTQHSGAEMHRALPPPFFEIKKCMYVMIWASPWMPHLF